LLKLNELLFTFVRKSIQTIHQGSTITRYKQKLYNGTPVVVPVGATTNPLHQCTKIRIFTRAWKMAFVTGANL
jgi:hypothetical protein